MSKVPDCPTCGKPLGLYYAECEICRLYADHYSYDDYFDEDEQCA